MGPKMVLKLFLEVVKVFIYAAAKSEHFRAFALWAALRGYFWKLLVGAKLLNSRMDSKIDSKMDFKRDSKMDFNQNGFQNGFQMDSKMVSRLDH